MCLFGIRIKLGWLLLRNRRLRRTFFLLPLSSLKNSGIRAEQSYPQRYPPGISTGCDGGDAVGPEIRAHSVPCLRWPSKQSFTKPLLFHLHMNGLPPLSSPKPLTPTSSVAFSWRWYLRWGLRPFWPRFSVPGSLPCIHLLNFYVIFSC